jgi:hypothetical protein
VRSRGSAAAGIGIVAAVVIGLGGYLLMSRSAQQPLPAATSTDIAAAMASMPASDVEGQDVAGLPRPPGSTRSFYRETGSVTTVIYDARGDSANIWALTRDSLQRAGWQLVGTDQALPVEGDLRLLSRDQALVQVRWFSGEQLVAISYVFRSKG